jgi:hypothetical protein
LGWHSRTLGHRQRSEAEGRQSITWLNDQATIRSFYRKGFQWKRWSAIPMVRWSLPILRLVTI